MYIYPEMNNYKELILFNQENVILTAINFSMRFFRYLFCQCLLLLIDMYYSIQIYQSYWSTIKWILFVWRDNMINEHTVSDTIQFWLLNKFFELQHDSFDLNIKHFIIFNWNQYSTYPNSYLTIFRTLYGCNVVNDKHSRWRFECHDKRHKSVHQYFILYY